MRVTKLTMSAFGPYAGKQELDMAQLGASGMYLVTGDTGAGKSTIFDAICYALYDEPGGEYHKEKVLRSKYADPSTETFVEMEFEYRDRKYRVWRAPEQEYLKKRGEGTTVRKPEPVLQPLDENGEPDGKPITKTKQVNEKLQEILGVSQEQFSQIVMIAQGEFRKLLQAKTDIRKEILRTLFRTEPYRQLQERLKEDSLRLEKKLKAYMDTIAEELEAACPAEGTQERVQWDNAATEERIELLGAFIESAKAGAGELEDIIHDYDTELEELAAQKRIAQQTEENRARLQALAEGMEGLQAARKQAEEARKTAEARKPEADKAAEDAAALNGKLEQYERLKELQSDRAVAEKQKQDAETAKKTAMAERETLNGELDELRQERSGLQDAGEQLVRMENDRDAQEQRGKDLRALSDTLAGLTRDAADIRKADEAQARLKDSLQAKKDELDATARKLKTLADADTVLADLRHRKETLETGRQKELLALNGECRDYQKKLAGLEKAQRDYDEAHNAAERARKAHREAVALYLSGQAGILAEKLEEGVPCPVCGSVHHPAPAARQESVPTEEKLKQYEETVRKAEAPEKTASDTLSGLEGGLFTAKSVLEQHALELLGSCPFDAIAARTAEQLKELDEQLAALKQDIRTAEENADTRKKLETDCKQLEGERDKLAGQVNNAEAGLAAQKAALQTKTETARADAEKLGIVFEQAAEVLPGRLAEAAAEWRRLNTAAKQERAKKKRREELDELIPQKEAAEKEAGDKAAEQDNIISAKGAAISGLEKQISEMSAALPYPTRAEAEREIGRLNGVKSDIDREIQEKNKAYSEWDKAVENAEGQIKALTEQLEKAPAIDTEALKARREEVTGLKSEAQEKQKELNARATLNGERLSRIGDARKAMGSDEKRLNTIRPLADTAAGTLNKKAKLALETYVQRAYFRRILARANRRLLTMSGGQYELCLREEEQGRSGQVGLDLDVLDRYNNTSRAVGSLSGGESFMASLSLALGLSDEIQASAGGIRMDSLFVDEGFGTLDENTLRQAMRALEAITDNDHRLVGIISHVAELKNRIDTQIIVRKEKTGGSRAEIRRA